MAGWQTRLTSVLPRDIASRLARERGLTTVGELLRFLPRRFLDATGDLGSLHEGDYVVFPGTVTQASTRQPRPVPGRKPRTMLNATVRSGEHTLALTFFSAYPHVNVLVPGARGLFAGEVSRYRGTWQLAHPVYELGTGDAGPGEDGPDPVRERPLLPSWKISRAVEMVLDAADLPDPVPPDIVAARHLPDFATAWRRAHLPRDLGERAAAIRRLKYDEALLIQLVLAQRRREQDDAPAVPRTPPPGGLLASFDARLPFELTAGQREVGEQIAADLGQSHPMNRLLQGDVGSGKTVVALRAMLAVIDAGGQAALLAPTEVLAQQHYRSLLELLGPLAEGGMLTGAGQGTRVVLLSGGESAGARKKALLAAASGEAGIVVGTHALLSGNVAFADLGLVVVDEQHRFGVEQRDALRSKARHSPHMLVMTATPIPRTVAMTVFGDMDTCVLRELPAGRSPIQTAIVDNARWYQRAWERVAEEAAAGRQAYVVAPRIGDDESASGDDGFEEAAGWSPAADARGPQAGDLPGDGDAGAAGNGPGAPMRGVLEMHATLQANPVLAGLRIGLLHGRLPAEVKDATMSDFAAGKIDVLVSTTVIEVGVDVPNATVMVIMDADRFGISQLHQLRGRVGRGSHGGLCLLVTRDPGEAARERLEAVAATTDGFALARHDLLSRREGDILGVRQSGRGSGLEMLRLTGREDERILAQARQDATALIAADPRLDRHPDLARMLASRLDERQAGYLQMG